MKITNSLLVFIASSYFFTITANADINQKDSYVFDEQKNKSSNASLQCWQYGKLLFEESGLENQTIKNKKGAEVFEKHGARDHKVYLFSSGSSTCLYKKP